MKKLVFTELVWKREQLVSTADGMHFGLLHHGTEDLEFTHFKAIKNSEL